MPDKEIFVLKIVWKKSIASLHRLTQAVQRANLRRTAGDPTWVSNRKYKVLTFNKWSWMNQISRQAEVRSNFVWSDRA